MHGMWDTREKMGEHEVCVHLKPQQTIGHHEDIRLAAASLDTGGGAGTHVVAIIRAHDGHRVFDNDRRVQLDDRGERVDTSDGCVGMKCTEWVFTR